MPPNFCYLKRFFSLNRFGKRVQTRYNILILYFNKVNENYVIFLNCQ